MFPLRMETMIHASEYSTLTIKSYSYKAEALMKDYLLSESLMPYLSVMGGIIMCKMAYDVTHWFSSYFTHGYRSLTKVRQIECNNRVMSSTHAIYITLMSLYLVFYSNLFSDIATEDLVVFRNSQLSTFALGIVHHLLSIFAICYAIFSGGRFLDVAGMKRSKVYIVNGVAIFFSWLLARLLLFIFLFYHLYSHYEQVKKMNTLGYLIVFFVPSILSIMNIIWFGKILRGLKRTLAKTQ